MGSAKIAKHRIAFTCWMDRLSILLDLAGHTISDYALVNFRLMYDAGMSPGKVAEQLVDQVQQ